MLSLPVKRSAYAAAALCATLVAVRSANAADWAQFRGPNGSGVAAESAPTPTEWSGDKNLKWSIDLPGQGVSCPIVVGDKVIVTYWTGTGPDDLMRHLAAYDRNSGEQLWDKEIPPAARDEAHEGMFTQTGYTAHTPASDGEGIYVFFGVSGAYKFDMEGNQVWGPVSLGTNFDERHWGTASSPILYKDKVIVTAASESDSLVALNKSDGTEVWKIGSPDINLNSTWSTPILVETAAGKTELVIDVPGEVRGLDPDTGKSLWFCKGTDSNSACPSLVNNGETVYAIVGRRGGAAVAVNAGGEGDVTGNVVWSSNLKGGIGTPVYHDGLLYWSTDGEMNCADAATGQEVYRKRLEAPATAQADSEVTQAQATEPAPGAPPADGQAQGEGRDGRGGGDGGRGYGGGGRGGRRGRGGGGGGGGFMQQDYTSPVIADGKIYMLRRNGDTYVVGLGRQFNQLAVNKFGDPAADFSATPAVADGQIYIRSAKKLYCVAGSGQL